MKIKLTLILLVFSILASAQDYQTKKIGDKEYYVYTVEASEGLFSVSRKFGVLQSEIIAANPNIEKGLKAGQTLYIPIKNAVQTSAQTSVKQQDNSKKYFEHSVQPKQTFFSICKMYGVTQEEVLALNQGLEPTKLKIGQVIKIPVVKKQQELQNQNIRAANSNAKQEVKPQVQPQKTTPKKKFIPYEVKKKKESLYSISKEFGVSINELLEANPEAENGVKKGDVLQIPVTESTDNQPQTEQKKNDTQTKKSNEITHVVQPKETMYGLSKKYGVTPDELTAANPQLKDGLKIGQTLIIPQQQGIAVQARNDEKNNAVAVPKTLKIAFLLPFTSADGQNAYTERFADFYKGALLALEDAKKRGISAEVQTFDTGFGTNSLYRILSEKFFEDADLIVGPAYPKQVSQVAAFAKKNNIAQIVPFTSEIDRADKHEYLYQFNPQNEDIFQAVADNFIEKFEKHNIVFINFSGKNDKGAKFADVLKKNLRAKSIKYTDINDNGNIYNAVKSKKNILVLATSDYESVANILPNIDALNNSDLEFWATDEIAEKLPNLANCYSYSIFNKDNVSADYALQYKKWFGSRVCKSTPCYDLIGYDLLYYFCNADFNSLTKTFSSKNNVMFQQSNFNFLPQKNGKGYLNYGFFLNCNGCK